MVEEQRARVEESMTKMLNDLDVSYLRRMQADMHRCAAMCCDSSSKSIDEVQRCVDRCSQPLTVAHKYVQEELSHFQDRLQRCIMQCNDAARDQLGSNPTDTDVMKQTRNFEDCAAKCVSTHIELIPGLLKKMKALLSGPQFQHK